MALQDNNKQMIQKTHTKSEQMHTNKVIHEINNWQLSGFKKSLSVTHKKCQSPVKLKPWSNKSILNSILHMLLESHGPLIYTLPSLCLKQEISDNQYDVHTINTQPWYLKITTQERAHEKCRSWLWKFHLTRTEKWNKSKIAKFKQENKSHGS